MGVKIIVAILYSFIPTATGKSTAKSFTTGHFFEAIGFALNLSYFKV